MEITVKEADLIKLGRIIGIDDDGIVSEDLLAQAIYAVLNADP